jgi:hypothetical protein
MLIFGPLLKTTISSDQVDPSGVGPAKTYRPSRTRIRRHLEDREDVFADAHVAASVVVGEGLIMKVQEL